MLVTGASSGIGREMARAFARRGAKLVVVARREAELEALRAELVREHGSDVVAIQLDLAEAGSARALFDRTEGAGIRVDFLVNNAGVGRVRTLVDDDPAIVLGMLELNIKTLTELTMLFGAKMKARGHGGILQVASMVSFLPLPAMAAYAASKAYVYALSRALEVEFAGTGVWVSVLCPGSVPSGFQKTAGFAEGALGVPGEVLPDVVAERAVRDFLRRRPVLFTLLSHRLGAALLALVPTGLVARSGYATLRKIGRV